MKLLLSIFLLLILLNEGFNQKQLHYVFKNENISLFDEASFSNLAIGVGRNHPCGSAYICAVNGDQNILWEHSFDNLGYSFFTDILKINDSVFYAIGEEWQGDDVINVVSIVLAKMRTNGEVLFFNKYTSEFLNPELYGPVNCRIHQPINSTNVFISVNNQIASIDETGVIHFIEKVQESIIDFYPYSESEIYYISDTALIQFNKDFQSEAKIRNSKGLHNLNSSFSRLYFLDQNNDLFSTNYDGTFTYNLSSSLNCRRIEDYTFYKDHLYIVNKRTSGSYQLYVGDFFNAANDTIISLEMLKDVVINKIDISENDILLAGLCNYGWPNNFFIAMDHNYNLPNLSKDLGISDFKQIQYIRTIDTITGGIFVYNHHFSFEYQITNHGLDPIASFNVYSDDYFHINCFHLYYNYNHSEELRPGESIILTGTGDIVHIGSPVIGICLKVAVPDFELDRNPDDNINCKTLVANDDPISLDNGFQIYPNPANDILHISKDSPADFKIYNSTGTLISDLINISNTELNIKDFKSGIYYIMDASDRNSGHSKKFIKQ